MYMDLDAHPNASPYYEIAIPASTETNAAGTYFHKPNFVIANLAVGGNFPGIYNISGITALNNGPQSMYIDWIRIYQCGDANQSFVCPSPSDPIEPEPTTGIEDVQSDNVQGTKELRNGQLLIRRGDNIYTITGQIVK